MKNLMLLELPKGVQIAQAPLYRKGQVIILADTLKPGFHQGRTYVFYRGADTMRCMIRYGAKGSMYFRNLPFRKGHFTALSDNKYMKQIRLETAPPQNYIVGLFDPVSWKRINGLLLDVPFYMVDFKDRQSICLPSG